MIINAHAHNITSADITLLNFYPQEEIPVVQPNHMLSSGIHPWHIHNVVVEKLLKALEGLCQDKTIQAIGECGLDKNTPDIEFQKAVFLRHIALSEKYQLPMIIHSVKAHHLIQKIKIGSKAKQAWILHGFTGSPEMAKQLTQQGVYLSFGQRLLIDQKNQESLNKVDLNSVLFETDDKNFDVLEVYKKAESVLNLSAEKIRAQIELNFKRIFWES